MSDDNAPLHWSDTTVRATKNFIMERVELHVKRWRYGVGGHVWDGQVWYEVDEGSNPPAEYEPAIKLERGAAQQLFEDLWSAGLRSKSDASASEVVAAKDRHIDDLRRMAFKESE